MNERDREWRAAGFGYGACFTGAVCGFFLDLVRWVDPEGAAATARAVSTWSPTRFVVMLALYAGLFVFSWRGIAKR